ncbi:MAG TPA: T9SS type A sorting domain-containing protein [Fulvivirga sp.]|nr:T9SS type A sorting domain-containing protein [Fulvivirga sp.]
MKIKNSLIAIAIVLPSIFIETSSLFAQTNWIKDANNPVLVRDTVSANLPNDIFAISDCWVMKEGSTYKMWYTCGGINYPTDTLLRSRLCYATSIDGVNWTKYSENPILDVSYTGEWDSLGVETASVIIDNLAPTNERYKMWYAGQYFNSYRYDIGYAVSPDGMNWTKHTGPVMEVGDATQWDNGFLEGPSVIKDGNSYKMWYCGYDAVIDDNGTDGHANVGYATSSDGIIWEKYAGNPVLTTDINAWDGVSVQDPHVIKQDGMYYMWYGGNDVDGYGQKVGYAWSSDGINWTKSPLNPVMKNGNTGEWDANTASFPSVIIDDGTYKMWYTGKDVDPIPSNLNYYWEIGYATAQTVLGINDDSKDQVIHIYPNPFSAETTLQTDNLFANATLTIYNMYGQVVKQINDITGRTVILHRDNLTSGLYYVQVTQGKETITVKKLVIRD